MRCFHINQLLDLPKGERHRVVHLQQLVNEGGLDDLTNEEKTVILDAVQKERELKHTGIRATMRAANIDYHNTVKEVEGIVRASVTFAFCLLTLSIALRSPMPHRHCLFRHVLKSPP